MKDKIKQRKRIILQRDREIGASKQEPTDAKSRNKEQMLILVQMTVCTILVLVIVIFKFCGVGFYEKVRQWYFEKMNDSLIIPEEMEEIKSRGGRFVGKSFDCGKKNKQKEVIQVMPFADSCGEESCSEILCLQDGRLEGFSILDRVLNEGLRWPLKSRKITSGFGMRADPFTGLNRMHSGLDIGAQAGEEIFAVLPGKVQKAQNSPTYGHFLVLNHGGGVETLYAHCSRLLVQPEQYVDQGEAIALVGASGRATGFHLHLEVFVDGVRQNPESFFYV